MGCGVSAQSEAIIQNLQKQNEELHKTIVKVESEKEKAVGQKVVLILKFRPLEIYPKF